MALSLGVKSGSRIRIGGKHILKVIEVVSPLEIVIQVDGGPKQTMTDMESVEILPEVKVFCGRSNKNLQPLYGRLAFEAPRSIDIERLH